MESIRRTKIVDLFKEPKYGSVVDVKGWVRTIRGNKYVNFIHLNDGSTIHNLQVVADVEKFGEDFFKPITTGACIHVTGTLVESQGKGQNAEIQADKIEIYGTADPLTYPLQKKGHSLEFLREIAYLRPRTNTFGAIFRIRHHMSYAIHKYFNDNGFFYFHTPIVTASDAEGAGSMFQVTTLDFNNVPRTEQGQVDYSEDFFGGQTNLTVSGQLEGELGAMALGAIYTFGPTFRAENSNTPRHLAEFWMIEPEVAFYDIHDNMDLAEDFLKYLIRYALEHCKDDIEFLNEHFDKELVERLNFVIANDFVRLTYTEGVEILEKSGQKFEFPVYWGADLQSEHERYLVEKHFKRPVILTDYPKEIKSFYMKQNEDGKTVRGMDVLFPKIGEIIGGSEREADYDKLVQRTKELNMNTDPIWWYMETRKFGTAPHAGFGLGFERLILFITGMANIRDVIPFPRTPNNAEF
ncbi:asparaginyl-tRNA synthetase [Dysgonomonas sp. PFB1-18]|uniref:asparagine--tRNA ligase n=1 Tax=unclassified Dysgonomonas TaxID=2630389 RepID=UPI002474826C|nr:MULTISPECIES: asparagine--tRNA ligase [unclassified Dysgonomonas]MDH6308230.1 asparaginyl-tRNA synthetase [Dysgonomonas sp. PF1-14]MDH6338331.1 asparaginyl-tRNA synthetase [Dysgonomonas sp. PF1-16]MDH6379828.1 asparaginyl-tRNA synthetase [Dysgonomonas sp. PFB1-18]MDH6397082.1 asparaginyl-tRNA synthetase [Dysgonomonas sp. PF1-23]